MSLNCETEIAIEQKRLRNIEKLLMFIALAMGYSLQDLDLEP